MNFFRRKRAEPPVMTLEGILGPNSRLDEAAAISVAGPEAITVTADGELLVSAGRMVHALSRWGEVLRPWGQFDRPVSALAASEGGLVAVGLSGGGICVHDMSGQPLDWVVPAETVQAADLLFVSESELAVVDHGYGPERDVLSLAPWDDTRRGKVWSVPREGTHRALAGDLHCPAGICRDGGGEVIVTEMEAARAITLSGAVRRAGFPAYVGRIRKIDGGYLLCGLSRRDPLIEFLKTEKDFVAEMKATIEPRHWISPRTTPEFSHDFPIELGATRLFGAVKPWAPSFSYGLLITLDEDLMPVGSAQSRADGRRHAICDATVWNGDVIAVSRASGEILNLGPKEGGR
ncbi:MAG: hypothetical protein KL863_17085 [Rhizobium sp.]|nr:hypothetical protein [Rhizobium sp.]